MQTTWVGRKKEEMARQDKRLGNSGNGDCDGEQMLEFGPDTQVQLTPQGRLFWEQMLRSCSEYAGRDVKGEQLTAIVRRIRAETGLDDPQFTDPKIMEMFLRYLREPTTQ